MSEAHARMPLDYDDYSDLLDEFGDFYDEPDPMDLYEAAAADCGWDPSEPGCLMAGSEHCDFECLFRRDRRRSDAWHRARARRVRGRGYGPNLRRFGFRAAWAIRRRCRLRRERREARA
jgi:hypothetical protein